MKKTFFFIASLMLLLLNSCGNSSTVTVEGVIDGGGAQNMRAIYCDNGSVNILIVPVNDGKFEFEANLNNPSIVEFFASNKSLMGRAYVEPGDNIECKLYKNSPYKAIISGNEISERWSNLLNDNIEIIASDNTSKINQFVSNYINNNKNDILSTILLLTEFHSHKDGKTAIKLLSTINAEARPQYLIESYESLLDRENSVKANEKVSMTSFYSPSDSIKTFIPHSASYSIIAFSNKDTRNEDELPDSLRSLRKSFHAKRLQIIDMSLDYDTTTWKKAIKNDSATWQQGWVLGAVSAPSIERLGITRLPYYIVVDSTGKQLFRGASFIDASALINTRLKNHKIKEIQ